MFLSLFLAVIVTEKTNILLRYLHQQWDKKVWLCFLTVSTVLICGLGLIEQNIDHNQNTEEQLKESDPVLVNCSSPKDSARRLCPCAALLWKRQFVLPV